MNIKILLRILKLAKDKKGLVLYYYYGSFYNIDNIIIFKSYALLVPARNNVLTDIRKLAGKLINITSKDLFILWRGYHYKITGYSFREGNLVLS